MKQEIIDLLVAAVAQLGITDIVPTVGVPENILHGDYTTTVPMQLASRLKKSPIEVANDLKSIIKKYQNISNIEWIEDIKIASPGFLNLFLTEAKLISQVDRVLKMKEAYGSVRFGTFYPSKKAKMALKTGTPVLQEKTRGLQVENSGNIVDNSRKNSDKIKKGRQNSPENSRTIRETKRILVEFAHPNTHKAFHIGHLRNITTGESLVRLLEAAGHEVIRANYQGDVGMHIAKCIYGILHEEQFRGQIETVHTLDEQVELLGKAYAAGSKSYEQDEQAKETIADINKKIYSRQGDEFAVYQKTRQWSLDYFAKIYERVNSHFDRLYFESEVYELGKSLVLEYEKKGVFEKSDGAIIFRGETQGLHSRVFLTHEGNPTYEGKEMGLGKLQFEEYSPDLIIHLVGPEQSGYFQVVFKALECIFPYTTGHEYHLAYGWVRLKQGKMSSRSGNVVLGEWLIDEAKKEIQNVIDKSKSNYTKEEQNDISEKAAIAAVKYAFLRVSTKNEIAFDFKQSVSFEGDSGPYLQYAYARCQSVLRKEKSNPLPPGEKLSLLGSLNDEERAVARYLVYFPDVVSEAARAYSPSLVCSYLFTLAQLFNTLYAKHPILGVKESKKRISLTAAVAQTLKNGLYLLGIEVLEKM